ncbi:MAG: hypothetical protein M3467_11180 [Actinomycetota bacterium]|jgi:hypothetical protein|nr:hypothetical protein [Actinomycetota bacterium]
MRWQVTASSKADCKRLSPREQRLFRATVEKFNEACDRWVELGGGAGWPSSLRVKPVGSAPGIFELTWSFPGPDGRATWEWTAVEVEGERVPAVRWRRIGGHAIFKSP